ncbi:L-fuculose-phosphate aldolase [Rhizobium sp. SG_E_25_P2]|jgi:L-fuculose-phosphate aldolase|uniref:class II aldolase/adducin family protein n=1 Tax=Rhizobium sp. SG_E_25_P2 TaxID=2879942 RepID=UPI0024741947|nr:class II aldolase/adducin family protein [Rhizobium sp. SG_E_25_P2]MDH6269066.1 L-fuculose-phosphate aldolase [Rhizobium sp. SG_E_25_P2]
MSTEDIIRRSIIESCRAMNASGLNQGTSGNISVRYGESMLISPSSIPYDEVTADMIASMPITGERGAYDGPKVPSVEWPFHLDIMRSRPDVNAVVHTHATFSTILAIARKPIPACHYMIAAFGGNDVRVADYARYGTQDLSDSVLRALEGRTACLMANHGMLACGDSLKKAMWRAVELETIAKQYYHSLLIGGPALLPDEEIAGVVSAFSGYGLKES